MTVFKQMFCRIKTGHSYSLDLVNMGDGTGRPRKFEKCELCEKIKVTWLSNTYSPRRDKLEQHHTFDHIWMEPK